VLLGFDTGNAAAVLQVGKLTAWNWDATTITAAVIRSDTGVGLATTTVNYTWMATTT
jgi:hypothetical protein